MEERVVDIVCPQCGNDNQKTIYGVEIQGVYDGILIWGCQICGHRWPRFEPPGRLFDKGTEIIAEYVGRGGVA